MPLYKKSRMQETKDNIVSTGQWLMNATISHWQLLAFCLTTAATSYGIFRYKPSFFTTFSETGLHWGDKALQAAGKSVAKSMNYVHPHLSPEVKDNIGLYAPILSALMVQPITLVVNLTQGWIAQRGQYNQQHSMVLQEEIKRIYERGQLLLKSPECNVYYNAALYFRQARQLFQQLNPNLSQAMYGLKLTDFYYNEALALFMMHRYSDEEKEYALQTLNQLLNEYPEHLEGRNLRGIIYLALNNLEKAKEDFAFSLGLDDSQTDIYSLEAYCSGNYQKATRFSFSQLDGKTCWSNHSPHLLLYYRAEAFFKQAEAASPDEIKEPSESKKILLRKALASYLATEELISKNPAFETEWVAILLGIIETFLALYSQLENKETMLIKIQVPSKKLIKFFNEQGSTKGKEKEEAEENSPINANKYELTKNNIADLVTKYCYQVKKLTNGNAKLTELEGKAEDLGIQLRDRKGFSLN
jgi:hypothetical protein